MELFPDSLRWGFPNDALRRRSQSWGPRGLLFQFGYPFRCHFATSLTDEVWNSEIFSHPVSEYFYPIRCSDSVALGFPTARIDNVFRLGLDEEPRIAI